MKGLLLFNKLNDLLYWNLDDELTRHFVRVAQKQGLAKSGPPKSGRRVVRLTKDALVHLFSPLVTTQRVMGLQLRNPYTFVKCPSGVGLAFEELFNCTIICVGKENEEELKRKATVVKQIIEFIFGPSFETLRSEAKLLDTLDAMIDSWDELRQSNPAFFIEAVERCQITQAANRVVVDVLREGLKTLGDHAPPSVKPSHAFLLTGTKLVAMYSRRGEEDLSPSDLLLIVLLVHATSRGAVAGEDGDKDGSRFLARVVMLQQRHDSSGSSSFGDRLVPRYVYACSVFGDVTLVAVCETSKDELAFGLVNSLKTLDAVLKAKVGPGAASAADSTNSGLDVEKMLALARKVGPPSPELARFERNLTSQWETARRNGFDAFVKDYRAACSARTKQANSKESSSSPGGAEQSHQHQYVSLRTRLVKFESLLAVIVSTLQEGFGLCCMDDFELTDGLDCLIEFTLRRARVELGDFSDFLRFKAGKNIDLVAFLEEFPSLVHFMYVDRRTNQAIAPGREHSPGPDGQEAPFLRKMRNAVSIVRSHLARGIHTVIWRDKSFVYSYHLWFENLSGEALIPRRESRNFASYCPYPGVIGTNFYRILARESFSTGRLPSTSSSPSLTGSSPRSTAAVVVKELYCVFSPPAHGSGLGAEETMAQVQKIAECLPVMLSSSSTVDFL